MKLLDKIALQRLISLLLSFILAVLKLFAPKTIKDTDERKRWVPRWRKQK